jgi:hypothetical protein
MKGEGGVKRAPRGGEDRREVGMAPIDRVKLGQTLARTDPAAAHCLAQCYRGGEEAGAASRPLLSST